MSEILKPHLFKMNSAYIINLWILSFSNRFESACVLYGPQAVQHTHGAVGDAESDLYGEVLIYALRICDRPNWHFDLTLALDVLTLHFALHLIHSLDKHQQHGSAE